MAVATNEFGLLHVKLADLLGDPRTSGGTLIAEVDPVTFVASPDTCSGIRWTSKQRTRILNNAIKWVMVNFPYEFLIKAGLSFGDISTAANALYQTTTINTIATGGTLITTYPVLRFLSVEDLTSSAVVPIANYSHLKVARRYHHHWSDTVMFYPVSRTTGTVSTWTSGNRNFKVNYIQDINYSSDVNIGIGGLEPYVLAYAVHLAKLYSQKYQEGLAIKADALQEIQILKGVK